MFPVGQLIIEPLPNCLYGLAPWSLGPIDAARLSVLDALRIKRPIAERQRERSRNMGGPYSGVIAARSDSGGVLPRLTREFGMVH